MDLDRLGWKCLVCGARRPDDKIDAYTIRLNDSVVAIVRHCNDRPDCVAGAPDYLLPPRQEHEQDEHDE